MNRATTLFFFKVTFSPFNNGIIILKMKHGIMPKMSLNSTSISFEKSYGKQFPC